ncbi:50S ribosomal protein L4 [Thermodesulfobacteriota bacterium]
MATLDVYNTKREKVSQVEVKDAVFDTEAKEHLFYDVIRMQQNAKRAGTSSSKTRSEVRGGGKKPWRQKGTGRARSGTSRSPIWRGGGAVFGPKPRGFDIKVTKKVRKKALCSALTMKRRQEKLLILDKFDVAEIKTKEVAGILSSLGTRSVLIIDDGNSNLNLSARNIPRVKVLNPRGLNLYDLLYYDDLYITQPCLEEIHRRLVA